MDMLQESSLAFKTPTALHFLHTRILLSTEQLSRLAHGYSGVLPIPDFDMAALDGAGALRSTASDLLRFLAANRGFLDSPLYSAMTNAHRARTSAPTAGLSVGLGWHLLNLNSGQAIWHNGATIGHRAFAGFLRNGSLLVVALANSDFDITDIGFHLLDPSSPLTTVRKPLAISEETLRHYVGRYQRSDEDRFTISLLEGHLVLGYSTDMGRELTMYPSSMNRFYLTFPEAQGTFNTNTAGKAVSLVWNQSGATTTYPKVRQRVALAIRRAARGVELRLSGDTDQNYIIESTGDLSNWSILSTNNIWDNSIIDPTADSGQRRFYRVREQ